MPETGLNPACRLRYPNLDWLRGLAICGILLMNIVSFALPEKAYLNPNWSGHVSNIDVWCWAMQSLWVENKFLTLFALLFGAGLALQQQYKPASQIRIRLYWLCLFGIAHFILLWEGDILLSYGLCGLLVLPLSQSRSSQHCLFTGILCYLIGCGFWLLTSMFSLPEATTALPTVANQILQAQRLHSAVTGYGIASRATQLLNTIIGIIIVYGWQLVGLMLCGAGLMKSGWLNGVGPWQQVSYRKQSLYFLALALPLTLLQVIGQWLTHWQGKWAESYFALIGLLAAPLMSLGYIALAMGFWSHLWDKTSGKLLSSIGRMALSNYLLQTVISTAIFSWFGGFLHFSRWQLILLFVPLIVGLNLSFSYFWLRRFRQGPIEWLWRKLVAVSTKQFH